GLWVQKGTPKEVIIKLNGAVVDALADPAVRQHLTDLGQVIATREQQTPAALAAYHKAEIEKWWPIIRAANIKVEANGASTGERVPVCSMRAGDPHRFSP